MPAPHAASPPPADLPPGLAHHPRYRILRELGRGGMGVVYQAEQTMMDRRVAIKVINKSLLDHPDALERFGREVKAAARLTHPNIVIAFDAEQVGDLHMLVMEYVEGQSLDQVLRRHGPLPVAHACHYVRQAALGVQYAFERGMVHRDIKPANLMLAPRSQVKILDFGLAKVISEATAQLSLTASGAYMGTPEYCAPEQATDARQADTRADIYSLGCTLYALLAGRPPFQGDVAVLTALAHMSKEPTPLPEVRPEVPAELWAVVARTLAKDPAQRYQTPAELAQALAPFCKKGQGQAAAPTPAPAGAGAGGQTTMAAPGTRAAEATASPFDEVDAGPTRPAPRAKAGGKAGRLPWRWPLTVGIPVVAAAVIGLIVLAVLYRRPDDTGEPVRGSRAEVRRPALLDCTGPEGLTAAEVRQAQEAWARYLGRQVEETVEIGGAVKMTFVLIPPGKFRMGSPTDEKGRIDSETFHEVTLTEPFDLGETEVTQAQYQALTGVNPSHFKGLDLPVETVTWSDATDYAARLTEKRSDKYAYRLPTEAEWEYACRGGRPSSQPFGIGNGRALSSREANIDGNFPYGGADKGPYLKSTCRVGSYSRSALGLHDMHGNVWEWCADWYGPYPQGNVRDPAGPPRGSVRVLRGGGWGVQSPACRAATRAWGGLAARPNDVGFRLARRFPPGSLANDKDGKSAGTASGKADPPRPPDSHAAVPRPAPLDCTGPGGLTAAEVRQAQAEWARYLGRPVEETIEVADGTRMTFVLVPPGSFRMGSPQAEARFKAWEPKFDAEALHEVTLTEPFDLGKTEVTQAQYQALTGKDPSQFKGPDLPAETVSFDEARDYALRLTQKRGDQHLYRLPTESEWEYACRGGRPFSVPFGVGDGNALSSREANFDGNSPYGGADRGPNLHATCRAGSYRANALGLLDMHGNVWEWCADWYGPYPQGHVTNPTGPTQGTVRVYRGGSWGNEAGSCRAAARAGRRPGVRYASVGFRLARSVPTGGR